MLAALAFVGACPGASANADPPRDVAVTATEYAFRAPDTVPAGLIRFRFRSEGRELHHMQIVRLADGYTLRELLDRMAAGELSPPWVTFVGGPSVPPPGGAAEVTLDLAPGHYALLCFVPAHDAVPHLAKGMLRPLTVVPAAGEPLRPASRRPRADAHLVLDDYSFTLAPELRAGRRTIRVENAAAQPHELFLVRLPPGGSAEAVLRWFERREGPPPFEPAGGAMALGPGVVNFVTAELTAGRYALICFVPDAADGRSHVAHGMVREIRVE
jgi:hypothetical protein